MKSIFLSILFVIFFSTSTFATDIKIASWNIKNLDILENARTKKEYKQIKKYMKKLNADIIALQEVNGTQTAKHIFPNEYNFYFSNRDNPQKTGFAIRKNIKVIAFKNLTKLNVDNSIRPHGQRFGNDIIIEIAGQQLRLLNVHLKSGCWQANLNLQKYECAILKKQTHVLQQWIKARASENIPFIMLGDFNRRFSLDKHYAKHKSMWKQLNATNNLIAINKDLQSTCWNNFIFPTFVDFIVVDKRAFEYVKDKSFQQLSFDEGHHDEISDHCPIALKLRVDD